MKFFELEIGARFRWRDEAWIKTTYSHARRESDGREEFLPSHDHILRADFRADRPPNTETTDGNPNAEPPGANGVEEN